MRKNIALLAVVLILCVAFAEVASRVLTPDWRDFYSGRFMARESVAGFGAANVGRAGFDGFFAQNNGDFRVRVTINAHGLRNDEPVEAADGRIWVIGDSFSFGWGVERDEMYSSLIAELSGAPAYNVASPGTDVCGYQALAARMPDGLRPTAVVVGLMLENDVRDYDCAAAAEEETAEGKGGGPSLAGAKILLTRYSALYNQVVVAAKRVDILREPLIALGLVEREHAYKRPFEDDEIESRTASTAREIVALKGLTGDVFFAVLLIPSRFEILDGDSFHHDLRLAMKEALKKAGIAVIDPFAAFETAGFKPTHFAHDGHWTPAGHAIAGRAAAEWLKQRLAPGRPS
jgi:hypothetical protein